MLEFLNKLLSISGWRISETTWAPGCFHWERIEDYTRKQELHKTFENPKPRCLECHVEYVPTAKDTFWHEETCPLQPKEQLLRRVENLRINYTRLAKHEKRAWDMVALWQGKYIIVKTENNTLRKKLYAREAIQCNNKGL